MSQGLQIRRMRLNKGWTKRYAESSRKATGHFVLTLLIVRGNQARAVRGILIENLFSVFSSIVLPRRARKPEQLFWES